MSKRDYENIKEYWSKVTSHIFKDHNVSATKPGEVLDVIDLHAKQFPDCKFLKHLKKPKDL